MPEQPSTPRGEATLRRILDAAAEEFALHGIAGARMERITSAAHTNKAQLYSYFGSKEGLFDAVIADHVDKAMSAVAFDVADLPAFAVAQYDENLRRPNLVRLITWTRLERHPTGHWFDTPRHEPKLAAIAQAQTEGKIRAGDPGDLLIMIMGMAGAWSPASSVFTASKSEPKAVHERRRDILRESVARLIAP
jgi:AcrR family transcriptional regulator